jgi:UDP-N-acetylglucosamine 2-epimerase (non-hydrolysing)
LKPVASALLANGITPTLIFTGQHPKLDPREFGLQEFPRIDLGCPGQRDPHAHVRAVTEALLPLLIRAAPELILVQGDTSSALGGALAAFAAGSGVAHVEAGLRTHDLKLPWPEEEYRVAIDAQADLLFAPTDLAAANLRADNVPGDIHVTGNTGIDALLEAERQLPSRKLSDAGPPRVLVTCHRRESWQEGLPAIAEALGELGRRARVQLLLHPNDYVAGRMRGLLDGVHGVTLRPPCGHHQLLQLMRDCALILSDSGGIQEEAPALGVPLLVLRDKTERPEGIAAGAALLVGTDPKRIVGEALMILDDPVTRALMSRRVLPYGDGRAARRIASIIVHWLRREGQFLQGCVQN